MTSRMMHLAAGKLQVDSASPAYPEVLGSTIQISTAPAMRMSSCRHPWGLGLIPPPQLTHWGSRLKRLHLQVCKRGESVLSVVDCSPFFCFLADNPVHTQSSQKADEHAVNHEHADDHEKQRLTMGTRMTNEPMNTSCQWFEATASKSYMWRLFRR